MSKPRRIYTVFGLVDNTTVPRSLTVAAVVQGQVDAVDEDSGSEESQRYAQSFEAIEPYDAELLAIEDVES